MEEEICKIVKGKENKLYIVVGEDGMNLSKETRTEIMKDLEVVFDYNGVFSIDWNRVAGKVLNKLENCKTVDRKNLLEVEVKE